MTAADPARQLFLAANAFVIAYYLVVNGNYLLHHALALLALARTRADAGADDPVRPGIAVIVPAYNEAETITDTVPSFLRLDYPDKEVVVVNDGSDDDTFERLREAFDLVPADDPEGDLPCEPVRGRYRSREEPDLVVIDKENGGKSDALNAGLWLTDKPLFCAVDSDTIVDRGALFELARPFRDRPDATVATGGTVRVANGCTFEEGRLVEEDLAVSPLVGVQTMEYLRAFYLGRLGLSRLRSLVLISGAFGVFRTDIVREIGGYRRDTVTEDFDLVLRLHERLAPRGQEYRVEFVPTAVAWTEVPASGRVLGRQRRRWYRGMLETLRAHRSMIGRRRYGIVGLYALPFYVLAEALGPLIEGLGYVALPIVYAAGLLHPGYAAGFLAVTAGFGTLLSWFAILGEHWIHEGYDRRDLLLLLGYGALENVGYRQWKTLVAWHGLAEYLGGVTSWGEMEREGLG